MASLKHRKTAVRKRRITRTAESSTQKFDGKPLLWGKHCRGPGCDDFNEQHPTCNCECAACKPPTVVTSGIQTKTALLTPLQVKEAVLAWSRLHGLLGTYEQVDLRAVMLRADGSAAIKRVKAQP